MVRRAGWLLALVVVAACGSRDEAKRAAPAPAPTPAPAPEVPAAAATAPPSTAIVLIAVTDAGDSALTSDENGELRWWPTLDGTREPIVVRTADPVALALGRDGDGVLATVLDGAGGLELVRLDHEGRVRGKATVPPEPGIDQVIAIPGGVLVRGRDQVVRRFDAKGALVGTLAPDAGERVLSIATRRGRVIAALGDGATSEIHVVRWISLDARLAWGATVTLPTPLVGAIALSPGGRRIVGASVGTGELTVTELGTEPKVIGNKVILDSRVTETPRVLGFLDDDHAILARERIMVWDQARHDPWAVGAPELSLGTSRAVVGDGVIVGSLQASLVLATATTAQTLGYRNVGIGTLAVHGETVTLAIDDDLLWLDHDLHEVRRATGKGVPAFGVALDGTRVTAVEAGAVSIVDTATTKAQRLGTWPEVWKLVYDDSAHVLSVVTADHLHRFAIEPGGDHARPLRDLSTPSSAVVIHTDPDAARGVAAIAFAPAEDGSHHVDFFGEGTPGETAPIKRSARSEAPDTSVLMGVDRQGRAYVMHDQELQVHAYQHAAETIPLPFKPSFGAVDGSGDRIVVFSDRELALVDHAGRVQWRRTTWQPVSVEITASGRTVLLNTSGGLLALDPATGKRVAAGCGWGFGLHETASAVTFAAPAVCGESE